MELFRWDYIVPYGAKSLLVTYLSRFPVMTTSDHLPPVAMLWRQQCFHQTPQQTLIQLSVDSQHQFEKPSYRQEPNTKDNSGLFHLTMGS